MKTLEMPRGETIIGTSESEMIGTVSPIPNGYWIGIGHPFERGILVDHDSWRGFVDLVKAIDSYVKENYEKICNSNSTND